MEATLLGKTLTAVIAGIALVYGVFLRPWRPRRMWARRVPAVDLLFVAALAIGLAAVHWPAPFERAARVLIDLTDLPGTLSGIDQRIRDIEELPDRIWSDLTTRLGWATEPPPPDLAEPAPGPVTGRVLPALTGVVEVLVRAFVYWGSLIVLSLCLVVRLAVGLTRTVVAAVPERRPDRLLEGRITELEEIVLSLRTLPGTVGREP